MRNHERIEELFAAEALDALDPQDAAALARELEEHGPACPECGRLRREYHEVAGRLALAPDPLRVSTVVEEDLMARARGPASARGPSAWGRRLLALAAAALLVVGGVGGFFVSRLLEERDESVAAFLADPETRVLRLEGAEGSLALAFRPDRAGAYLLSADLAPLPAGRVYEFWTIEGEAARAGGCFVPEDGALAVRIEADVSRSDAVAVSVEPTACPDQPTTKPLYSAPLSS